MRVCGGRAATGRVDARLREVAYREGQVVQLTGYVGYHIHLELAPRRDVRGARGGGRGRRGGRGRGPARAAEAEGGARGHQPDTGLVAAGVSLRVSGAGRAAVAGDGDVRGAVSLPGRSLGRAPVATPVPFSSTRRWLLRRRSRWPRPAKRGYWYCGSRSLAPVAASDDGVQTRLTFSTRGEWPAIFVRNEDGSESLVNFHAEGTTAVLHRVAPEFVLRRGAWSGVSRIGGMRAAVRGSRAVRTSTA